MSESVSSPNQANATGAVADGHTSKTPEFEPPAACVYRLVRTVLKENMQLNKDSKAAFVRAVGVFVYYITHCANDICKQNRRSTIYSSDVVLAMQELGFGDLAPLLEKYLEAQRPIEKRPRGEKKRSRATMEAEGAEDHVEEESDAEGDA